MHFMEGMMNVTLGVSKLQGTIIRSGDILKIGKDFVDAVSGKLQAQGRIRVGVSGKDLTWVSTMNCIDSETLLRKSVKDEGGRVTYFESQGV